IRDRNVTGFRRVLFRSKWDDTRANSLSEVFPTVTPLISSFGCFGFLDKLFSDVWIIKVCRMVNKCVSWLKLCTVLLVNPALFSFRRVVCIEKLIKKTTTQLTT